MHALAIEEELVLHLRFGHDQLVRTPKEVAELLGMSPSAEQRIESRALRKLRLKAIGPVGNGWDGWDEV